MAVLEYDFRVTNANIVHKTLAGIEQRLVRHNQFVARQLGGGMSLSRLQGRAAVKAAQSGPARDKNIGRQYAEVARAARASYLKQGRDEISAARMVEREKVASIRRVEREQASAARRAEAAARRQAAIEARAQKAAVRTRQRFAAATRSRIGGSAIDATRGVGMLAAGALSIGGGFAVAGALQQQAQEQALASQLANQAGNPAMKGQLLKEARGVRGFSGTEALAGMSNFVAKTGDLDMARRLIPKLGELSLATGADLNDLGDTAGHVFNVLSDQIKDPVKLFEEMNAIMGTLAQQGAMGAVEIKDLAQEFGKLGAATRAFEGGAPDLLRAAGALGQMAVKRGGAPDAAEAATAVMRLSGDIAQNRKQFAGIGVDIQSKIDPTKLRNPLEIMLDALEKTGGDVLKTAPLFGERADKVFRGVGSVFSEAEKTNKGSGRAAVMAEFGRFAGAKLDPRQLAERAKSRLEDPDLQFKEALKDFNAALGQQLLPTLTKLIPTFKELLPQIEHGARLFAQFVQGFAENPVAGIGKLIALKIVADLAMANIGSTVSRALSAMIGGIGGAGAGGPGFFAKPTTGGMLNAAGMGAQIGLTAATVILTAGIVNFENAEANTAAGGQRLNMVRRAGVEDIEAVRQAVLEQRKLVESNAKPGVVESLAGGLGQGLQAGFGVDPKEFGRNVAEALNLTTPSANAKADEGFLADMEAKLSKLESAAAKLDSAAGKISAGAPNRGNTPSPIKG